MTGLTFGSLFSGYGGLDLGVQSVLGGETSWFVEFDKAPSKILAHHWPTVPNLGDVTKVDWASVAPVDVITGGSPCQDLSHAGKRKGMTDGTRSNLWVQMREAIATIRPRLVVWENVRGALSANAASDVERCPGCMGGADDGGSSLRALGRVAGDLAELGYDSRWYGLRAADVGGAHGRFRVFLFATPADDARGFRGYEAVEHDGRRTSQGDRRGVPHQSDRDVVRVGPEREGLTLLLTPVSDNSRGLPSASTDYASLANVACALLPTPGVAGGGKRIPDDAEWSGNADGRGGKSLDVEARRAQDWREYAAAIARSEAATGRTAPPPTEPGTKGNPRLSPAFVEWLMMLPAGHVTDPAIGLTRNEQLKALGNGVVPPQAAAATRAFLADTYAERGAA